MKVILRYRNPKPENGHLTFLLPEGATVLAYVEHWHTSRGWEIAVDVLEDTQKPRERRWFFLCNSGDDVSFIGDFPDLYYVGMHEHKSYISYLFDTSHLSETERERGKIEPYRYVRKKPDDEELSTTVRKIERDRRERAHRERT